MTKAEIQQVKLRFGIIGNNEALMRAIDIAIQVAPTDLSVLITGESGVGKESFPQIIHQYSRRKHGQYIAVNCGAIPEGTIDSELFGHEKGAFTGAANRKMGLFEEAHHGTIFLDEIGDMYSSLQAKLLRVLQERTIRRVGGTKDIPINIRVVAATNRDLKQRIDLGTFREDLFYRLNVFPIMIPPLRERGDDVVALAEHFVAHYAAETEKSLAGLSPAAMDLLMRHNWPGNVRELENVIHRAVILAEGSVVHVYDLPLGLQQAETPAATHLWPKLKAVSLWAPTVFWQ